LKNANHAKNILIDGKWTYEHDAHRVQNNFQPHALASNTRNNETPWRLCFPWLIKFDAQIWWWPYPRLAPRKTICRTFLM